MKIESKQTLTVSSPEEVSALLTPYCGKELADSLAIQIKYQGDVKHINSDLTGPKGSTQTRDFSLVFNAYKLHKNSDSSITVTAYAGSVTAGVTLETVIKTKLTGRTQIIRLWRGATSSDKAEIEKSLSQSLITYLESN